MWRCGWLIKQAAPWKPEFVIQPEGLWKLGLATACGRATLPAPEQNCPGRLLGQRGLVWRTESGAAHGIPEGGAAPSDSHPRVRVSRPYAWGEGRGRAVQRGGGSDVGHLAAPMRDRVPRDALLCGATTSPFARCRVDGRWEPVARHPRHRLRASRRLRPTRSRRRSRRARRQLELRPTHRLLAIPWRRRRHLRLGRRRRAVGRRQAREDGRRVNEPWGRHHLGRVTISGYGVRVRGEGCVRAGEQAGAGGRGGSGDLGRQRLARFVWGRACVVNVWINTNTRHDTYMHR